MMTCDAPRRAGRSSGATKAVYAVLATLLLLALPASAAVKRGCIDNDDFVDLAGDDAVMLEVNLSGALLSALSRIDPELHQLVTGLHSIQAVILDLSAGEDSQKLDDGLVERARRLASATDKGLRGKGWERIARVRDDGADIKVLVLNDDEVINGLVVMVLDRDEGQLVFANICGTLDLAAIQAIGQGFDIPGLEQIEAP